MKALGIAMLVIAALVGAFVADHHFLGTAYPSLPEWAQPDPQAPAPIGANRLAPYGSYGLALLPDDRVYVWGGTGHEGFPGGERRSVETATVLAEGASDWRAITAGPMASYAVADNGALWRRSMLPRADGGMRAYRTVLKGLRWDKVQSLSDVAVGLDVDGTLRAWHERLLETGVVCTGHGGLCLAVSEDGDFMEGPFETIEADIAFGRATPEDAYGMLLGRPVTWPIPEGPWMDFCVAEPGYGRAVTVHALDASGQPWRIELQRHELDPPIDPQVKAAPIFAPVPFQRVYCAADRVMLLDREQRLWGYGDNRNGALWPELKEEQGRKRGEKNMQQTYEIEAKDMRQLTRRRWVMVAPAAGYTVAISGDGSLWAWGEPYHRHILRNHSPGAGAEPILVDASREWVEVATAGAYLMARDAEGKVHTWGATEGAHATGLLGDAGAAAHRDRPRPIVIAP